jgi:hypothetical protein
VQVQSKRRQSSYNERGKRMMSHQCSLSADGIREVEATQTVTDVASPLPNSPGAKPAIQLNLEDLRCFEVVERQFQDLGITFKNAIALQPSNPAFPARTGNTVLMGAPKSGFLEAIFLYPATFFSGYITSSQRSILSAYDRDDKLLERTEMPGANLAGSDSSIPTNYQMILRIPNIHRITFYAFDGQIVVSDASFGF